MTTTEYVNEIYSAANIYFYCSGCTTHCSDLAIRGSVFTICRSYLAPCYLLRVIFPWYYLWANAHTEITRKLIM